MPAQRADRDVIAHAVVHAIVHVACLDSSDLEPVLRARRRAWREGARERELSAVAPIDVHRRCGAPMSESAKREGVLRTSKPRGLLQVRAHRPSGQLEGARGAEEAVLLW